jgi:hypothetical protein
MVLTDFRGAPSSGRWVIAPLMAAVHTSETSVNTNLTTRCYIPEDQTSIIKLMGVSFIFLLSYYQQELQCLLATRLGGLQTCSCHFSEDEHPNTLAGHQTQYIHLVGSGSCLGKSVWDFRWTKCTGTGFSPSSSVLPLQYYSTMAFHIYISSGGWTVGPLVAAGQRHGFTPSTWTTINYLI